ncbi:restriction endonuclease subunit S [Waltera acetigignens]|uniref:restriction endonuclease subunit S n=1 Tax=Waltera acetigignens TaxID=2981769 RepID=UPI0021D3A2B2|nr:restriction endonuclease subunit S [Brotolimicola acetigignens]MCU6760264.1 restriction endonuclease subunit S [Brotolimicola acetigignens]
MIQYGLSNSAEAQGTHRLLRITDIQDGKVNWKDVPFTTVENAENYLLRKDDIVFARTGATVGKSFLVTELPFESVYASYLIRIRLFDCISPSYLYQFFNSYCYWEQITDKSVGVGQPNCNGTSLKELFIPLPPLHEQKRIVPAANALLKYASVIESERASLQEIINLAKSKILDLAIRGKLVPPDPNDEPASVLLERIRAEKEELIRQGKIKRDKKESFIFRGDDNSYYRYKNGKAVCIDDDLPYEVPNGWIWAILPEVVLFQEGPGILKKDFRDEGIPLIRISGLQSDKVLLDGCNYLDPVMVENKWKHFKLELGDVILCTSASIGKASIVGPEAVGAIPYTGQIRFKMTQSLIREYFLYFANSDTYLNQIDRMKTGNCIQHYGPTHLKEVYIPIPPIEEQERIIKQLSSLLSSLYEIEESITM